MKRGFCVFFCFLFLLGIVSNNWADMKYPIHIAVEVSNAPELSPKLRWSLEEKVDLKTLIGLTVFVFNTDTKKGRTIFLINDINKKKLDKNDYLVDLEGGLGKYEPGEYEVWIVQTLTQMKDKKISNKVIFNINGAHVGNLKKKEQSLASMLPVFSQTLKGHREIRVRNPNSFIVYAGIRKGKMGVNLKVPAKGIRSVYVPDGVYEIYFVYSSKPDALFKGDDFSLNNNGVEIQIVKVVGGNYGIRRVK